MKSIYLIGFYLLTLALISCKKDTVTSLPNQLVINSLFSTDSIFSVSIAKDLSMLDAIDWTSNHIDGAKVILFENGIQVESPVNRILTPYELSYYNNHQKAILNYFSKSLIPKPGYEYKILVQKQGFPDAEASTIIPKPVDVQVIDTIWYMEEHFVTDTISFLMSPGLTPRMAIDIQFKDPSDQKNFYLLELDEKFESNYSDTSFVHKYSALDFDATSPIFDVNLHVGSGTYGRAFSDKAISGQTIRLRLSPDWQGTNIQQLKSPLWGKVLGANKTYYVKLYSITEDYYLYLKTLEKYNENRKSPFYPPVQIHSNVSGGLGIFAGASVSTAAVTYKITKWF